MAKASHFHWDDDEVRFLLYNALSWIFIVLAHRNNSPRKDMSHHSDTLSWFRTNQSLLFLLNAACFAENEQIPMGLIRLGLEHTIYSTRGEHENHYTTDAVEKKKDKTGLETEDWATRTCKKPCVTVGFYFIKFHFQPCFGRKRVEAYWAYIVIVINFELTVKYVYTYTE